MRAFLNHIPSLVTGLTLLFVVLIISPSLAQSSHSDLQHVIELAKRQGIPGQKINHLILRAQVENVPQREIAAILQPAIDMAAHDLPYDLILQKSMEGMAKGVQPALIVEVERKLQSNALDVVHMTDQWISEPSIQKMIGRSGQSQNQKSYRNQVLTAMTQASFQGVSHEQLHLLLNMMAQSDIASTMDVRQVPSAIGIFPDLPTSKDHPDISRALIIQAVKEHFTPDQIQQLPIAITSGEQMGRPAAESLTNALNKQLNNRTFAATVLRQLFEGNFRGGPSDGIPPGIENHHTSNSHANGHGMNNHGNGQSGNH